MAAVADTQFPQVAVRVRKMGGGVEVVEVQKRTYYMVSIWHEDLTDPDESFLREAVVAEETAAKAKAFVKANLLEVGEEVSSASKVSFQDAAVLKMRGWNLHNA